MHLCCFFFLLEHNFLPSTHTPVNTRKFTTHPEDRVEKGVEKGRKNCNSLEQFPFSVR